jgi:sigma-B regulation protein RsbU (phosphoserine phosphatase)
LAEEKNISENAQNPENDRRDDRLRLKSLLQVTQAINNNFSRTQLLAIYEKVLKNRPFIKSFVLFTVKMGEPFPELSQGINEEELAGFSTEKWVSLLGNAEEVKFFPPSDSVFYNLLIPAHHKGKLLAFLAAKTEHDLSDARSFSENEKADIEFVQTLTNVVFVALENKVLAKENLNQEIFKKEMELASELQAMLFPPDWNPGKGKMEIDAFHKTFTDVGGDYYDFFSISETETAFCIADVSGKGVSAALLMSNFQAAVRSLFRYEQDLGKLAVILNEQVDSSAKGEKFITVFLAKYNASNRKLTYINCGHNPPLLVKGKQFRWLSEGLPGLGMLHSLKYTEAFSLSIETGSILVCYTDGITECENQNGAHFGQENLKEIVLSNNYLSPSEINHEIILKLNAFVHDKNKFQDDVALLTCRFNNSDEK